MVTKLILAGALSFIVSLALTPILRRMAIRRGLISYSRDGGRWKDKIIARLGGVAIFSAFVISASLFALFDSRLYGVVFGASLIFVVGLIDDLIHIKPYSKLIGEIVAGCVLIFYGVNVELMNSNIIGIPLTIFWVVFLTNAFNLLDNMDGLAGGVCFIASVFLCMHSAFVGNTQGSILSAALAGSVLGFLRYNLYPAKIYMGDCGSLLLGFLLASISLLGTWRHSAQVFTMFFVPALILSVPIFDTAFVAINRSLNNRNIFHGGTDHTSHRLAIMGLSERRIVFLFYGISFLFGLIGIFGVRLSGLGFFALILLSFVCLLLFGAYLAKTNVYRMKTLVGSGIPKTKKPFVIIDTMLLHKRRMLEIIVDLSIICASYVMAYLLRFEGGLDLKLQGLIIQSLPLIIAIKISTFFALGMYRGIWRYVGINDLVTIFKATAISSIFAAVCILYLWRFEGYSRAVFIIDWALAFIGICGARVTERILDDLIKTFGDRRPDSATRKVLIFGAGDAGEMVLREIKNNKAMKLEPVGFIDDDAEKIGKMIHGVPVLGSGNNLADIIKANRIDEVLIAISSMDGDGLKNIDLLCRELNISCRKIDGLLFTKRF